MGKIDDLYRKYAVKVNTGSGCLFQPDTSEYTYVLTAKHNIQNEEKTLILSKENIKIYRGNEQNPGNELKVLKVFPHRDEVKDAAILEVKYVDENIKLDFNSCQRLDYLRFFGYPQRRTIEEMQTAGVDCNVDMEHPDGRIEIVPKKIQFTYDASAHANIKGFSGCGVFKEINDDILLVGILSRLADETGAGDNILIMPIDYFKEIISQNTELSILNPRHLASFDVYVKKVWKNLSIRRWAIVLEEEAKEICKKGINPIFFLDHYYAKLLMTMNSILIHDSLFWLGWIEFLVYCKQISIEMESKDRVQTLEILLDGKQFFYSGDEGDWAVIISEILDKYKNILKVKDKVVVNSNGSVYIKKLSSEALKNILNTIDDSIVFEAENAIDRVSNICEDFTFIHISAFREKIGENATSNPGSKMKKDEIKIGLKECILEVFK
jgi:hypothetical protein